MKWTKKEEMRLKELAPLKTISELATEFKTTEDSIRNKLRRLKLNYKPAVRKEKANANPLEEHKQKTIERYDKQFVNKLLKERTG